MNIRYVSIALSILFLVAGAAQLSGMMVDKFVFWGYPSWFSYVAGGIQVIGAVTILFPKIRRAGALILAFVMINASGVHILKAEMIGFVVTGLLFASLTSVAYMNKKEE